MNTIEAHGHRKSADLLALKFGQQRNIYLQGPPGAGKSSIIKAVPRLLHERDPATQAYFVFLELIRPNKEGAASLDPETPWSLIYSVTGGSLDAARDWIFPTGSNIRALLTTGKIAEVYTELCFDPARSWPLLVKKLGDEGFEQVVFVILNYDRWMDYKPGSNIERESDIARRLGDRLGAIYPHEWLESFTRVAAELGPESGALVPHDDELVRSDIRVLFWFTGVSSSIAIYDLDFDQIRCDLPTEEVAIKLLSDEKKYPSLDAGLRRDIARYAGYYPILLDQLATNTSAQLVRTSSTSVQNLLATALNLNGFQSYLAALYNRLPRSNQQVLSLLVLAKETGRSARELIKKWNNQGTRANPPFDLDKILLSLKNDALLVVGVGDEAQIASTALAQFIYTHGDTTELRSQVGLPAVSSQRDYKLLFPSSMAVAVLWYIVTTLCVFNDYFAPSKYQWLAYIGLCLPILIFIVLLSAQLRSAR